MAITLPALKLLVPHLRGRTVLALGYPDILATPAEASQIVGATINETSAFGESHKRKEPMVSTTAVFAALKCPFMCIDIMPSRGVETVVDLNEATDLGKFGAVLDAGTIEHCANIGGALMNAANAVADGGIVFHSPPLNMINHGFYNTSPTLLVDFYSQNGWNVMHLSAFRAAPPYEPFEIDAHARQNPPPNCAVLFLAERGLTAAQNLRWPTQYKYLRFK